MKTYIHKVQYYETDKMGITHHSNYIRWMEEARVDYLSQIGYGINKFEEKGITSPVVSVDCQYIKPTTFDDNVKIEVSLEKYTGVKFELSYIMTSLANNEIVSTAKSTHCLVDKDNTPVIIKKIV